MIYKCIELNKEFSTKEEMFKKLRLYKNDIISFKKAQIMKSCDKGISITAKPLDYLKLSTQVKDIPLDDNYYYIAVNSTRILDKHLDLHLDGIWNKTAKDQQGKNYLVDTHVLSVKTTIAKKEHIEIFTAFVPFSMIGKKYKGDTEVLIYKIRKDKIIDSKAKEWLDSGDAIEASVRMQYIDIVFAMDSDDKEDVREKKTYDQLIKIIANKEDFDSEITHFWGIRQAKNVLESSLVLFASNHVTGQMSIENNKREPLEDNTPKTISEPSEDDTQRKFYLEYLKHKS